MYLIFKDTIPRYTINTFQVLHFINYKDFITYSVILKLYFIDIKLK